MRKMLIGVFVVWCSWSFAQTAPEIKSTHPRIDVEQSRLEWLRENIYSSKCSKIFTKFKRYYYDEILPSSQFYMIGSDTTKWNFDWNNKYALETATLNAFMVQLEVDKLSAKRSNFIARRYAAFLNNIDYDSYKEHDPRENVFRFNCNEGSLFFDWTYNVLEPAIRQKLARSLYAVLKKFLYDYILDLPGGESYVTSHNVRNCGFAIRACLVLYEADGLSAKQRKDIEDWYNILFEKWDEGILPGQAYFRGTQGGWNWGSTYGLFGLHYQYQFFDDMLAATGKNYYEEQEWIKTSINQYWYYFRPSHYTIHFGDGVIPWESADRVMYRHAAVFKDVRSQYLAQKYGDIKNTTNAVETSMKLLQYDFHAPKVKHPDMPLNFYAPRVGMSVSRTSWKRDATMVWFSSPTTRRADHEHRDNNTFVVIKDKPLILHSGSYALFHTPHYRNYYSRTIAHNSICVFDGEEQYTIFGENKVSNDGGQLETERFENVSEVSLPEHQRAVRLKYADSDNFVYNVADAGKAYNPEKMDRFERRLLYLKPDRVIVLDHLHINNIGKRERKVKYINHFVNRPEINGEVIKTTIPDKIVTYNGKEYRTVNGNGSVGIKTLLPQKSTTTLIGGEGYEFWVDGKNYPPDTSEGGEYHPGAWRIEVEPEEVVENQIFLHTIKIGDGTNPAQAEGKLIKNSSTIGVDWNDAIYLFSATGKMECKQYLAQEISGNRDVAVKAYDLKSNAFYGLFVNDNLVQEVESSDKGIVEFDVEKLAAGSNKIEVKETSVSDVTVPELKDDEITTDEDTDITQHAEDGLLANDAGDLTITNFKIEGKNYKAGDTAKIEKKGSIKIDADGAYQFHPAPNFNGKFPNIVYTVDAKETANFTIIVNPISDKPEANDDNVFAKEDTKVIGNLLTNDKDVDNDELQMVSFTVKNTKYDLNTSVEIPQCGEITIKSDGEFTFVPETNYNGTLNPISYTITDKKFNSSANLNIEITAVNDGPDAVDDYADCDGKNELVVNFESGVLVNDTDVDTENLKVVEFIVDGKKYDAGTKVSISKKGTFIIYSDGSYVYTPIDGYKGSLSLTYIVSDGELEDRAELKITVNSVNHKPIGRNDDYSTNEDKKITVTADNGLLSNDSDSDNDVLKIVSWEIDNTQYKINTDVLIDEVGTINISDTGAFEFVPLENFNGNVPTITYVVTDEETTVKADLKLVVNPENDKPMANDDFISIKNNKTFMQVAERGVLSNDIDVDGDQLKVVRFSVEGEVIDADNLMTIAEKAEMGIYADGSYSIEPKNGYSGELPPVIYTITDGEELVDAVLNITLEENTPFIVKNDTVTTNEDVAIEYGKYNLLENDSSNDGKKLQVKNFTIGNKVYDAGKTVDINNNGSISINVEGELVFSPDENFYGTLDPIEYTVDNGDVTESGMLIIKVLPVNDKPNAVTDYANCKVNNNLDIDAANGVLSNDTDIDSEKIEVVKFSIGGQDYDAGTIAEISGKGTVVIKANGSYKYNSASNYSGEIIVNYTITDGELEDESVLTIKVNKEKNRKPVANDDNVVVSSGSVLEKTAGEGLLSNDSDEDGDLLNVISFEINGKKYNTGKTVALNSNSDITIFSDGAYKVTVGNSLYESFPDIIYTISDGEFNATARLLLKNKKNNSGDLEEKEADILIYPNPTVDGNFNVVIKDVDVREFTVDIYNAIGQKVANHKSLSNRLLIHQPKSGFYFLMVKYLNKKFISQLIVLN